MPLTVEGRRGSRSFRLLALAPLAILLIHALSFQYVVDDAFISYRYARNWVEGHGLVYNPGERVEGYSNFAWVMLSGLAIRAGLDPVTATRAAGIAAAMGTLLLLLRAGRRPRGRRRAIALLPAALLALNTAFALWSQAGLETALFTFLVTGGVLAFENMATGERHHGRFPVASFWFAGATLTRPEGPLFFGLAALGFAFHELAVRRRGGGAPRWHLLRRAALLYLVLVAPYVVWKRVYYGAWLPNTFHAKSGGLDVLLRGVAYLGRGAAAFGFVLLPFPFLLLRQGGRREQLVPATVIAGYLAWVVWVGGDGLAMYRCIVPVMPLIFLLLADAFESLPVRARPHPALATGSLIVLGALSILPTFRGPDRDFVREDRARVSGHWTTIGHWLREYARPGESIAVTTAGAIPYYSQLPAIDMLGITDAHIARRRMPSGKRGIAGHEKHDIEYVLDRRPTYILHHEFLLNQPVIDERQFDTPWNPGLAELARSPRFAEWYQPVSVPLGPRAWFCFFVLRPEAGGPAPRRP